MNEVGAPWAKLLLVCTGCRGARHRVEGRDIRKGVKRTAGKEALRVLEVDCLKLCPDEAVAVCVVDGRGARCLLVQDDHDVEALAQQLAAR